MFVGTLILLVRGDGISWVSYTMLLWTIALTCVLGFLQGTKGKITLFGLDAS